MGAKLTDGEVGKFDKRLFNLRDLTVDGTRPLGVVSDSVQMLADGRFSDLSEMLAALSPARVVNNRALPSCFDVSIEELLERARKINVDHKFGFEESDFPTQLPEFVPSTETSVLMPVLRVKGGVGRNFDAHANVIESQLQGKKRNYYRDEALKSDSKHLRRAPTALRRKPGVSVVEVDFFANWEPVVGHKVSDLWFARTPGLAASENLDGLMLFPEWGPSMNGTTIPYANMPGYQVCYEGTWDYRPYAYWWGSDSKLLLSFDGAGRLNQRWSSSQVLREY